MRAPDKIKVLGIADLQRHEFMPGACFIEQVQDLDDATTNFTRLCPLPAERGQDYRGKGRPRLNKCSMIIVIEKHEENRRRIASLDRQAMLKIFESAKRSSDLLRLC